MVNIQLPSARVSAGQKSRVRPKTRRVWRCTSCKSVFDTEPYNRQTCSDNCPTCGADAHFIRQTRVED